MAPPGSHVSGPHGRECSHAHRAARPRTRYLLTICVVPKRGEMVRRVGLHAQNRSLYSVCVRGRTVLLCDLAPRNGSLFVILIL
jgi:hypothetical protein